jgi:branched-subunit amino acid transport protein
MMIERSARLKRSAILSALCNLSLFVHSHDMVYTKHNNYYASSIIIVIIATMVRVIAYIKSSIRCTN